MPAPEEALSAGNITFTGYEGAEINAYQALPAGAGPFPGVLVIHHLPGWDSTTKEITRRFAAEGYNALCPNLYARQGLDVDPDDAAAATREAGGIPDDQFVGDADGGREGAAGTAHVQRQSRRHRLLLGRAALVPHRGERARRCGGRLLRGLRRGDPSRRLPAQGDAAGRPDAGPQLPAARPLRQRRPVPQPRAGRRARGGAARRPARPTSSTATTAPATRSSRWTGRPTGPRPRSTAGSGSSSGTAATWRGADHVLLPHRRHRDRRQRQGSAGLDARHLGQRVLRPSLPCAVRPHPQHRLRRPRRVVPAPASPSSSARTRRAAWSRASTRRWPLQGPPPCDHAHRPGGRRPPALGRGARRGADVGGRLRWRRAPTPRATWPAGSRRARPRCWTARAAPSS